MAETTRVSKKLKKIQAAQTAVLHAIARCAPDNRMVAVIPGLGKAVFDLEEVITAERRRLADKEQETDPVPLDG